MKGIYPDRNLAITIGLRFVAPEVGGSPPPPPHRTIFPQFYLLFHSPRGITVLADREFPEFDSNLEMKIPEGSQKARIPPAQFQDFQPRS
jgi:hypothetical protein